MFQATKALRKDTLKLVRTINSAVSEDPAPNEDLDEIFDAMWPKLENRLATLPLVKETVSAKRTVDDMVAEILQIVRTESNTKSKHNILAGVSAAGVSESIEAIPLAGLGAEKTPKTAQSGRRTSTKRTKNRS